MKKNKKIKWTEGVWSCQKLSYNFRGLDIGICTIEEDKGWYTLPVNMKLKYKKVKSLDKAKKMCENYMYDFAKSFINNYDLINK